MDNTQSTAPASTPFTLETWHVDPASCRLKRDGDVVTLEPKVMDMLCLLASDPGRVWSRDELLDALWHGMIVGEDTLARTVSRLRKALGDDPKEPAYLETIPKRGYRLIAAVSPAAGTNPGAEAPPPAPGQPGRIMWMAPAALLVAMLVFGTLFFLPRQAAQPARPPVEVNLADTLTARGDDFYIRMTEADNEAAILLYERAIEAEPDHARAHAGLANALVQRVIRWQDVPGGGADTLGKAVDRGLTRTPLAEDLLARAQRLAERAVALAPQDPAALKALGFVLSARADFDRAGALYREAIAIDPDAWAPLINLGEIHLIRDEPEQALPVFIDAYDAMARIYDEVPQQVGPWHAELGVEIGRLHETLGDPASAETWYRRVLALAPLEADATARLAFLLEQSGDAAGARDLCARLAEKAATTTPCPAGPVER